jgi:hypothetical protein
MRNDERAVGVRIMLALDVRTKVRARNGGVGGEKDVDWVVNRSAACNDLGVVVIEIAVEHFNVTLD